MREPSSNGMHMRKQQRVALVVPGLSGVDSEKDLAAASKHCRRCSGSEVGFPRLPFAPPVSDDMSGPALQGGV